MIVDRQTIQEAFANAGVSWVEFWDSAYALPSADWLPAFGASYLAWRKRELTRPEYIPESNDCDKFARDACDWASILHRNTANIQAGLAFGVVIYPPDSGGGHAINAAVCRIDGIPTVIFWEPQTQQEVKLSDNERRMAQVWI